MKKFIYSVAALCLGFFASCAEDTFESYGQSASDLIQFSLDVKDTRVALVDNSNLLSKYANYTISAVDAEGTEVWKDGMTKSGNNIVTNEKHYWPVDKNTLDFYVQPKDMPGCTMYYIGREGDLTFDYEAPEGAAEGTTNYGKDGENAPDIVFAASNGQKGKVTQLEFQHALASVRFVYASPNIAHKVTKIEVRKAYAKGSCIVGKPGDENLFNWGFYTSYDPDTDEETINYRNYTQVINQEVLKNESQQLGENLAAVFTLIPGEGREAGVVDNVEFVVWIDNQPFSILKDKRDLKAGKVLTVNINDKVEILPEGVGAGKTYTKNDNGNYDLRLETFVKGAQHTETVPVPADIVLVVDVSGSMKNQFTTYNYTARNSQAYTYNNYGSNNYYYKHTDNNYYVVSKSTNGKSGKNKRYRLSYTVGSTTYYLSGTGTTTTAPTNISSDAATIWTGVLYTQSSTTQSKMTAVKNAIKTFVDKVSQKATQDNVIHRIALVKFAGTKRDVEGNDTYKDWGNTCNYTQIVKSWTSEFSDLKTNYVEKLNQGGATSVDYGMEHAETLFGSARQGAAKVVVMLTDGEPNHSNNFDGTVANTAISKSKALKDDEVKVWSVYVGSDGWSSNVENYMQGVSSNYPKAKAYTSLGTGIAEKKYFVKATDTEALNQVFTSVTEDVGGATVKFNTKTEIKDVFSSVFDLPEDATKDNVELYTSNYISEGNWGVEVPLASDAEMTQAEKNAIDVQLDPESRTFQIVGFDYGKYFCGTHTDGVVGKKLVVYLRDLKLTVDLSKGQYFTNGAGSGIYAENDKGEIQFYPYPSPEIGTK